MESPPFEEIGGVRFALLVNSDRPTSLGFSRSFPLVICGVVAAFLLAAKYTVSQIERGNDTALRIFGIGILSLPYVAALAALIYRRVRKNRFEVEAEVAPPDYPREARQVLIQILDFGKVSLKTVGWIWVQDDLLRFRGERFAFDLRCLDFQKGFDASDLLRGKECRLLTPNKLPRRSIRMKFLGKSGGSLVIDSKGSEGMQQDFDRWRRSPLSDRKSLYPPIRRNTHPGVDLKILACTGIASVLFFGLGLLIQSMFAQYTVGVNKWGVALAAGLCPVLFLSNLYSFVWLDRSVNRSIDRLKASKTLEMK